MYTEYTHRWSCTWSVWQPSWAWCRALRTARQAHTSSRCAPSGGCQWTQSHRPGPNASARVLSAVSHWQIRDWQSASRGSDGLATTGTRRCMQQTPLTSYSCHLNYFLCSVLRTSKHIPRDRWRKKFKECWEEWKTLAEKIRALEVSLLFLSAVPPAHHTPKKQIAAFVERKFAPMMAVK